MARAGAASASQDSTVKPTLEPTDGFVSATSASSVLLILTWKVMAPTDWLMILFTWSASLTKAALTESTCIPGRKPARAAIPPDRLTVGLLVPDGGGGVAAALPELVSQTTKCKTGRFFKGPFLGKQAPLEGVNLVRDPAGCPTAVLTIPVTCPVGEEPTETDVKELIKLAHKFLQCAADCKGSKVNSLFSEFSKQIGQVTESISPKAAPPRARPRRTSR